MDYTSEICATARAFSDGLDKNGEAKLRLFSEAANSEIRTRLKKSVNPDRHRRELVLAGACLAYASFVASEELGAAESFSAGSLNVKLGGAAEKRVREYRALADVFMLGLIEDGSFAFAGVRG